MSLYGSLYEENEATYSVGEHFVPELVGADSDTQYRLEKLRREYIGSKLNKDPSDVQLVNVFK